MADILYFGQYLLTYLFVCLFSQIFGISGNISFIHSFYIDRHLMFPAIFIYSLFCSHIWKCFCKYVFINLFFNWYCQIFDILRKFLIGIGRYLFMAIFIYLLVLADIWYFNRYWQNGNVLGNFIYLYWFWQIFHILGRYLLIYLFNLYWQIFHILDIFLYFFSFLIDGVKHLIFLAIFIYILIVIFDIWYFC